MDAQDFDPRRFGFDELPDLHIPVMDSGLRELIDEYIDEAVDHTELPEYIDHANAIFFVVAHVLEMELEELPLMLGEGPPADIVATWRLEQGR